MSAYNIDLTVFDDKMPWKQRVEVIHRQFPSVDQLDWNSVFKTDPAILGRIVNDIIKQEQARPGTPGKRPSLDPQVASQRIQELAGEDYSLLGFHDAFNNLKGTRSIRHVADKVGLDKSLVLKLLHGKINPTMEHMETIASGFKKQPGYFHEYRVAYVLSMMFALMNDGPESAIVQYRKLSEIMKGS